MAPQRFILRDYVALLGMLLATLLAATAAAQQKAPATNTAAKTEKPAEPPKPQTRAEKAAKMYSDAFSLAGTGRTLEAAALYESLVRQHPTSEWVPQSLAQAMNLYYKAEQTDKAEVISAVLRKSFANCQHTVTSYWTPAEIACRHDKPAPVEKTHRTA